MFRGVSRPIGTFLHMQFIARLPLVRNCFLQVYLVVGGFTSTTELLTEGASAWTFASVAPLQKWKTVVSINNEIITTGECVMFWLIP